MQTARNLLFYISPLVGAVLGGVIGLAFSKFFWVFEVLFGFAVGCGVSIMMIVWSVRARFRSDPSLMEVELRKANREKPKSDTE
ncbi:MAG: hypothetical protein RL693_2312 [Verrucomicrobiota bacterium]|jgi:positive regulator of sigma E activity